MRAAPSRAWSAIVAALAITGISLGSLPAGAGGAGPATAAAGDAGKRASALAAADCVPVEHTKRVVKRAKVRRKGKWVRTRRKRVKRWWTCEPVAPPPPPPPGCAEPSSTVGVTAYDATGVSYVLSRSCVDSGQVNVELRNQGEDPHNLFMRPVGGSEPVYSIPEQEPFELAPLGVLDRTVALAPGEWYLWCSLFSHEQHGMNATLSVK